MATGNNCHCSSLKSSSYNASMSCSDCQGCYPSHLPSFHGWQQPQVLYRPLVDRSRRAALTLAPRRHVRWPLVGVPQLYRMRWIINSIITAAPLESRQDSPSLAASCHMLYLSGATVSSVRLRRCHVLEIYTLPPDGVVFHSEG